MTYPYLRLGVFCLSVACGGADGGGGSGGDGGGAADAGPLGPDARPAPSCESNALEVAWSTFLRREDCYIAFDTDGTLVVSIPHLGTPDEYACAGMIRFAPDGTELWRRHYDPAPPPRPNYKECQSEWDGLAIDPDGAILTIGDDVNRVDQPGATDIVVRKHDRDANALWTYFNLNAPDDLEGTDSAGDIAVDPNGDIVATGLVASVPWVTRLTPEGTARWIWSGSGDAATQVDIADSGDAFVGIATDGEAPSYRITRFDREGDQSSVVQLSRETETAVTPDGGLVYVPQSGTPRLRKMDAGGDLVWERDLEISVLDAECRRVDAQAHARATVIGPDGSIYLALKGAVADPEEEDYPYRMVLARFSPDGELLSAHSGGWPQVNDLAVAPDGSIAIVARGNLYFAPPLGDPEGP